jgi:hypothetical protein
VIGSDFPYEDLPSRQGLKRRFGWAGAIGRPNSKEQRHEVHADDERAKR